jgi:hypothetical protein
MPVPYRTPNFPDLQPISSAASIVADLLEALKKAGWGLREDSDGYGWRVARLDDEHHSYAVVTDAHGYWHVGHASIPSPGHPMSAAAQLRALADELERTAQP